MRIEADNKKLQYCGRIDWSNPKEPVFVYPCTSLRMRFTGEVLKIYIRNKNAYWDNYLGCMMDGRQISLQIPVNRTDEDREVILEIPVHRDNMDGQENLKELDNLNGSYSLAEFNSLDESNSLDEFKALENLDKLNEKNRHLLHESENYMSNSNNSDKEIHDVLFFKRQDSCHELTILSLEIGEGEKLLDLPEKPRRKIEVYGDSVSAGEVSEAIEYVGKEDPAHNGEYSNSWYSYAWMTARKLNAQIHDVAQGGIALMDGTGWFCEPNTIGMESVWDKIHYNPELGEEMEWDFSNYIPQVVIIAIGQNDSHPRDYMKENYEGEQAIAWRKNYKRFLAKIRRQYPEAYIVCCTTLLEHDEGWDLSIKQVVDEMNDSKITQYMFKRNGKGTPGHLRISEAEEMAEELATYIEKLSIKEWE